MAPEEKNELSRVPAHNSASSTSSDDRVFLENWSLSLGLFLLGLLCRVALGRLSFYFNIEYLCVIDLIMVPVYALWIYPSLFTDKPVLKSRGAVSFLNAFVGGLIFGAIWGSNLTKRHCGISHYVCVSLVGAAAIALFCFYLIGAGGMNVGATSKSSPATSISSQSQSISIDQRFVGTWQIRLIIPDMNDPYNNTSADDAQMHDEFTIRSNGSMTYTKNRRDSTGKFEMYMKKTDVDNEYYVVDKQSGSSVAYMGGRLDTSPDEVPFILFAPGKENDSIGEVWVFYRA